MTGWGKSCEIRKEENMKYELENEQLHVEFQSFGGALSSIKDQQGIEFLWQGDKNYWSGQAPVLFPICGSIRDDKAVTKDGKNLTMPRHGIVRKREFECVHPIKYWAEQLTDKCFCQPHRSFIVNLKYVQKFDNHLISLAGDRVAYLTRRKYKEFKDAYLFYLESAK